MGIVRKLLSDARGATAIEYALVAWLISIAAMAGYQSLGNKVVSNFNDVSQTLNSTI